jgi:hypothetical protein
MMQARRIAANIAKLPDVVWKVWGGWSPGKSWRQKVILLWALLYRFKKAAGSKWGTSRTLSSEEPPVDCKNPSCRGAYSAPNVRPVIFHYPINLGLSSGLAGSRLDRCNNRQPGLGGLPRIRGFQVSWTSVFLAKPLSKTELTFLLMFAAVFILGAVLGALLGVMAVSIVRVGRT